MGGPAGPGAKAGNGVAPPDPYAQHRLRHVAPNLRANGYPFIPVVWGRKAPLLDGWTSYWEGPPSEDEVEEWLRRWPDAGVGIPGGLVVGVDVDILDDNELADRLTRIALADLGHTPCIRYGNRPKALLIYRTLSPFKSIKQRPIEFICLGHQFVAFNLHEDTGRLYDWPDEDLQGVALADLPVVTEAQCRAAFDKLQAIIPSHYKPAYAGNGHDPGPQQVEHGAKRRGDLRAIEAALKHIDNDGEGLDYDWWIKIAFAIKHSLGLDGADLFLAFSQRSTKFNAKQDTLKTYLELKPSGDASAASIYWLAGKFGWKPGPEIQFDAELAAAIEAGAGEELFEALMRGEGEEEKEEQAKAEPKPEPQAKPATAPSELPIIPDPGGALGMFRDWVVSCAHRPQPLLAMGGGVPLLGAIGGRRYRSGSTRSNVLALMIGAQGSGKEMPRECAKGALTELAGGQGLRAAGNLLGPARVFSGSAIVNHMAVHPVTLLTLNEIGFLFKQMKRGETNQSTLTETLLDLSTTAGSRFPGTGYADRKGRPMQAIEYPCLCIQGASTASALWRGLSTDDLDTGFLQRFLVFQTLEDYPYSVMEPTGNPEEPPEELIKALQRIWDGPPDEHGHRLFAGDIQVLNPTFKFPAYDVPYDARAREMMIALLRSNDDRTREEKVRTGDGGLWTRRMEHTRRLALVHAFSRWSQTEYLDDLVVNEASLQWAMPVALCSQMTFERGLAHHVASNEDHAAQQKIIDCLRKHGRLMNRRYLFQLCRRLGDRLPKAYKLLGMSGTILEVPPPLGEPPNEGAWVQLLLD